MAAGERQKTASLWAAILLTLGASFYPLVSRAEIIPTWVTFTPDNSDLPHSVHIQALLAEPNGTVWIGTFFGGLACLDKNGSWQTYTKSSTHNGLPDNRILSLALAPDGSLWVAPSVTIVAASKAL